MTTETTTPAERAKQISDRLLEIAPYPETGRVTADTLARYLAVRASVIGRQQTGIDAPYSRSQIDLMTILFAAALALSALEDRDPGYGTEMATEIRDAWEDGGGIGEWLWAYLGDDEVSQEVGSLADELAVLQKPTTGILAHAGAIRRALEFAAVNAESNARQEPYRNAILALEDAISRQQGEG